MELIISLARALANSGAAQNSTTVVLLAAGLLLAGVCANWKLSVVGLAISWLSAALLLFGALPPLVAFVRLVVGGCVLLILGSASWAQRDRWQLAKGRSGLTIATLLLVYALAQSGVLRVPVAAELAFPIYALFAIGVGLAISAEHLLYAIIGVFMILLGCDLTLAVMRPASSNITLLLAALQIMIALTTVWIAAPPRSPEPE